jgi:hypothetical protein
LDYLASIDEAQIPADSGVLLAEVADGLASHFPGARIEGHGVAVSEAGEDLTQIRVVPARLVGQTDAGYCVYEVADGVGGWMRSSPDAHNAYVTALDRELDGKLKPLIRLSKAWKYFRNVGVSSFYLELRCAIYAASEEMIVYSVDLGSVFDLLWADQLADMFDQEGVSGRVSARVSRSDRKRVLSELRSARYHANRAQEEASAGDMAEAFRNWNRLFNGRFPAYG